ncbi:MAG: hypothetical protein NVS1B9_07620 [Solirubrobacteraceae bacterium]
MSITANRRLLLRDGVLTSGASLIAVGLGAVASIVLARILGATGRGTTAAVGALAVLCSGLLTFGAPAAAAYALGRRAKAGERTALGRAFSTVGVCLALLVALVFAAIAFATDPGGADSAVLVAGMAVAGGTALQQILGQMVLTGVPGLLPYALVQVLPAILNTVVIGGLALAGDLTVLSAVLASALGSLTGCAAAGFFLGRASLILPVALPIAARSVRPYVGFAVMTAATISLTQVVQRLDILLVAGLRSTRDAGIYAVAAQVGDLLLVVPAAIGTVMFRRAARSDAGHRLDLRHALRWTGLSSILAAGLVAALATPFLTHVVGREFSASAAPLRLLLPGVVLLGLQSVVSNYIAARGRVRAVVVAWLTGALLSTAADILVIPAYGVKGAAVVSSLSYAAVLLLHVRALRIVDGRDEGSAG